MKKNRVVALLLCAALLLSGFTNTMVKAAGATGKQTTTAQKSKWPSGPSKSSLSSDSAIVWNFLQEQSYIERTFISSIILQVLQRS